tara:strand:- start:5499 stop:5879 length:381 start_codon:yes stop_codon:yes gene_type:complete
MEKHHKLRRPAGSSIHGCNICGIEGHQAAHCPNGNQIDWGERFGPEWTGDLDTMRRVEPDYDALAVKAKVYAETRLTNGNGDGTKKEGADAPGAPPPPSAWRVYYDQMGRPYYHNAGTGQTQWTPP